MASPISSDVTRTRAEYRRTAAAGRDRGVPEPRRAGPGEGQVRRMLYGLNGHFRTPDWDNRQYEEISMPGHQYLRALPGEHIEWLAISGCNEASRLPRHGESFSVEHNRVNLGLHRKEFLACCGQEIEGRFNGLRFNA
jgi:hypothetical protein